MPIANAHSMISHWSVATRAHRPFCEAIGRPPAFPSIRQPFLQNQELETRMQKRRQSPKISYISTLPSLSPIFSQNNLRLRTNVMNGVPPSCHCPNARVFASKWCWQQVRFKYYIFYYIVLRHWDSTHRWHLCDCSWMLGCEFGIWILKVTRGDQALSPLPKSVQDFYPLDQPPATGEPGCFRSTTNQNVSIADKGWAFVLIIILVDN